MKPFIAEHWNSFNSEKYYVRYKLSPYEGKSSVTIARIMEEMYQELLYSRPLDRIIIEVDKYTYSTLYREAFGFNACYTGVSEQNDLRFRGLTVLVSNELDHEIRMIGIKEEIIMPFSFKYDELFSPIAAINVTPTIKKVIFNKPATIVYWSDNTKTVVKCGKNDEWDKEKGLAMAISKKLIGLKEFYKQYNNTTEEKENKK